ncbi:MAG: pantoate--beta-alanine ligase [Methylotenera sp.]
MQVIQTVTELRSALKTQASIALVPTMGNLHAGHIHLVEIARQHAQCVVVSIFVNPLQFGANEDLASYPRTLEADCEKLKTAGADIVFTPGVDEVYPDFNAATQNLGQTMLISAPPVANELCGAARPGHFDGVATVVMKLFNMVMPQVAVFGKKDFQQLFVIRELVKQFNLPIEIIAGETVREADGLAMSSRNGYLTPAQKTQAAQLQQHLKHIVSYIQQGASDFDALTQSATQMLNDSGWLVDYVSVRSALTLAPATAHDRHLVVLAAAKLGNTRLIDNIEFLR